MTDNLKQIEHIQIVREADIDLLVCEELSVSPDFAEWFLSRVLGVSDAPRSISGAWTHVLDRFGECDVLAVTQQRGKRTALLIENKIDEDFQPVQAERYIERGSDGAVTGLWNAASTVLIAPANYPRLHPDAVKFHAFVSYEDIQDWFHRRGDVRSEWRARVMRDGIEQNRKGYVKQPDPRVTMLWKSYFAYRAEHFPQVAMPEPGPQGARNGWPKLGGLSDRDGVKLLHKLDAGYVDLAVASTTETELARRLSGIELPANVGIVETGKSAALRITVPPVDRFNAFEPQAGAVHIGLQAAEQLLLLLRRVGQPRLTGRSDGVLPEPTKKPPPG
jgi:hypothetical protein